MKKVGAIIIGILLGVLLLVVSLSSVATNKSKKSEVRQSTKQEQTTQQKKQKKKKKESTTESTPVSTTEVVTTEKAEINIVEKSDTENDVVMKEVDINTIPYSNELHKTEAIVSKKHVYIKGDDLFYCVELNPTKEGCDVDCFTYYVSYSSYNSLSLGDICVVEYENIGGGLVSIYSLAKK